MLYVFIYDQMCLLVLWCKSMYFVGFVTGHFFWQHEQNDVGGKAVATNCCCVRLHLTRFSHAVPSQSSSCLRILSVYLIDYMSRSDTMALDLHLWVLEMIWYHPYLSAGVRWEFIYTRFIMSFKQQTDVRITNYVYIFYSFPFHRNNFSWVQDRDLSVL